MPIACLIELYLTLPGNQVVSFDRMSAVIWIITLAHSQQILFSELVIFWALSDKKRKRTHLGIQRLWVQSPLGAGLFFHLSFPFLRKQSVLNHVLQGGASCDIKMHT